MTRTLLDLANEIESLEDVFNLRASELASAVALAIVTDLVSYTPVDTSKALSNWQIGLDLPNHFVREPYFAGSRGSTQEFSAANAISKAREILARKKPGQLIFISNAVPYINDLDAGSSSQSPGAFRQRAELVGRKTLESLSRKI